MVWFAAAGLAMLSAAAADDAPTYQPTWESVDSRPCPGWFDEAKFGIFIHWGVYSVPSWGPKGQYAEWYWHAMEDASSETSAFHKATYGERFRYQDFAPQFHAELWKPDQWAEVLARSGAKYVVLTSKHHDGFCLWPSAQSWNWNSVDVGPHRDIVGELSTAVKAKGLRMGLYYSLYEWYNPLYQSDPPRYVETHMLPQLRDLMTRYQPSLLFTDGEWDKGSDVWRAPEFLAWLFNESPVKHEVVVNDRWGNDTRSVHGGYFTTEYGKVGSGKDLASGKKWEENRAIGASFGYNRNEDLSDYMSAHDIVKLLVQTVAKGGNLCLDIGPAADGTIPVVMQQRLAEVGDWLAANGEAIYGTTPWKPEAGTDKVAYTAKGDAVYAFALEWPKGDLQLPGLQLKGGSSVSLLAPKRTVSWYVVDGTVRAKLPALSPSDTNPGGIWVLKITKP